MALDFPTTPTVGQVYSGYTWDGEKWTNSGYNSPGTVRYDTTQTLTAGEKTQAQTNIGGAFVKTAGDTMSGHLALPTGPAAANAVRKDYVDAANAATAAAAMKTAGGQTITGGFALTPNNLGTPGSFTPNPLLGNYQYFTNNGALTITAPTTDCAMDLMMTNGASAGAVTFSGFTFAAANYGDLLTAVNGSRFIISIRRINGISTYTTKALQ